MGTENIAKKIDLVVMTGSIPFITAGLFQDDYSDATLISGALSGMSNMFQEMLQQGELRHSELYNAHVYIRHLTQMNDKQNLISPEIKHSAQMRVAIIVREGELTREQEIALSELCYSIMITICQKHEYIKKLLNGNIEGYIPTNKEIRDILAEAINDYRNRAKKSILYENINFLQEKDKLVALPTNDILLESKITEFFEWVAKGYYPDYFPKIDFMNFFGKRELENAINMLKIEFKKQLQKPNFKEKISSDLFQFIIKSGLMPLVLYPRDIRKRLEWFISKDLLKIFDLFISNYTKIRGPVGIGLRSIEDNLKNLAIDDKTKVGWHFLKNFLEEINDRPLEIPFLKQIGKIIDQFEIGNDFLKAIIFPSERNISPNEYSTMFAEIVNSYLSKQLNLEELRTCEIVIGKNPSVKRAKNTDTIPELPMTSTITTMDESLFSTYCELRKDLSANFQQYLQTIIITIMDKKTDNGITYAESFEKLLGIIQNIEKEIERTSFGSFLKSEIERVCVNIRNEKLENAQSVLLNVIESFEAIEVPDNSFLELLDLLKETNQHCIVIQRTINAKKTGRKKKSPDEKPLTKTTINIVTDEINDLIKKEEFKKLSSTVAKNAMIFDKKTRAELKAKISILTKYKEQLLSEKQDKTKSSSNNKQKAIIETKKKPVPLPKATPESSRVKDNLVINAICKTFTWAHELIFGKFFLSKKNLPTISSNGLLFYNISESLTIEIGVVFDIIQSFTAPRTWVIGQLGRIVDTIERKIKNYSPNGEVKYKVEEKLSIDIQHVDSRVKKIARKILEIVNKLEANAVTGKITEENKKSFLESGFLGRVQEVSIPNARKYLHELKSINKNLSSKELDLISKATNIKFKTLTTNITSVQLIVVPLPVKDSEFNKSLRELSNKFGKWKLELSSTIESVFRFSLEISDPLQLVMMENRLNDYLRTTIPDSVNDSLEALLNSKEERREYVNSAFLFKKEIFSLIGLILQKNKPLSTFSNILVDRDGEFYTFMFSEIKPPTISEELQMFFITNEGEDGPGIIGRHYTYQPFKDELPSNLTELIISDAFRRAYEIVDEGLVKIAKMGKKIHSGIPNVKQELMNSYEVICNEFSFIKEPIS